MQRPCIAQHGEGEGEISGAKAMSRTDLGGKDQRGNAAAKTSDAARRHGIDQPSGGGEKDRCARQSGGSEDKSAEMH